MVKCLSTDQQIDAILMFEMLSFANSILIFNVHENTKSDLISKFRTTMQHCKLTDTTKELSKQGNGEKKPLNMNIGIAQK